MTLTSDPVLYVIVCGAGPAGQVTRLISDARARGWDPYIIATPAALDFLDTRELEAQTGHSVRSEYRKPGQADGGRSLPKAHAIIVAPATYNTINKCANGISDNFALGILAEAVGLRIPRGRAALRQQRARRSPGISAQHKAPARRRDRRDPRARTPRTTSPRHWRQQVRRIPLAPGTQRSRDAAPPPRSAGRTAARLSIICDWLRHVDTDPAWHLASRPPGPNCRAVDMRSSSSADRSLGMCQPGGS